MQRSHSSGEDDMEGSEKEEFTDGKGMGRASSLKSIFQLLSTESVQGIKKGQIYRKVGYLSVPLNLNSMAEEKFSLTFLRRICD